MNEDNKIRLRKKDIEEEINKLKEDPKKNEYTNKERLLRKELHEYKNNYSRYGYNSKDYKYGYINDQVINREKKINSLQNINDIIKLFNKHGENTITINTPIRDKINFLEDKKKNISTNKKDRQLIEKILIDKGILTDEKDCRVLGGKLPYSRNPKQSRINCLMENFNELFPTLSKKEIEEISIDEHKELPSRKNKLNEKIDSLLKLLDKTMDKKDMGIINTDEMNAEDKETTKGLIIKYQKELKEIMNQEHAKKGGRKRKSSRTVRKTRKSMRKKHSVRRSKRMIKTRSGALSKSMKKKRSTRGKRSRSRTVRKSRKR